MIWWYVHSDVAGSIKSGNRLWAAYLAKNKHSEVDASRSCYEIKCIWNLSTTQTNLNLTYNFKNRNFCRISFHNWHSYHVLMAALLLPPPSSNHVSKQPPSSNQHVEHVWTSSGPFFSESIWPSSSSRRTRLGKSRRALPRYVSASHARLVISFKHWVYDSYW